MEGLWNGAVEWGCGMGLWNGAVQGGVGGVGWALWKEGWALCCGCLHSTQPAICGVSLTWVLACTACALCCSFEGANCNQDIDECVRGLDDCSPNAACVNTPGSFTCQCYIT